MGKQKLKNFTIYGHERKYRVKNVYRYTDWKNKKENYKNKKYLYSADIEIEGTLHSFNDPQDNVQDFKASLRRWVIDLERGMYS